MPTNWSFRNSAGGTNPSGNNFVATGVIPATGDLMICTWAATLMTLAYSGATISDTGSSGWNQINTFQNDTSLGGTQAAAAWWKVATTADHNAGSGVTVTVAATGGTGVVATFVMFAENYGCIGVVQGIDLNASKVVASNGAQTFSPVSGSSHPSFTDELAWASAGFNNSYGVDSGSSFTGTSSTTTMTTGSTTGGATAGMGMFTKYLGSSQASATAGTNVWSIAWITLRFALLFGATFYYKPANNGNMLLVMGT